MSIKQMTNSDKRRPKELLRSFKKQVANKLGESGTAREVYGYVDFDEKSSLGKFLLCLFTDTGIEHFVGEKKYLGSDEQSGALKDSTNQSFAEKLAPCENDLDNPSETALSRLRDQSASAFKRVDALRNLLNSDADAAASYMVAELDREDISDDWRNVLVFLAEDFHFPIPLRQRVGERLLAIARQLRLSTKAGIDKVVWSAMRRAFSLLSPDPGLILPFLERQGAVDTRSVALRCIERQFELAPPSNPKELEPIADRVAAFAFKFLDPDVFAGGENASIAQNAVCALASLGDTRLGEAIRCVKILGRRWMNRQIRVRLEQLLAGWRSRDVTVVSNPAFRSLEEQIGSLS